MLEKYRGYIFIGLVVIALVGVSAHFYQNWRTTLHQGQLADYLARAQAAEEKSRYQEAFELYSQALELDPNNLTALTGIGNVAFSVGDYATAVNYYQQAGLSDLAENHYFLALKAIAEEDLDAAIKELTVTQQKVTTESILSPSKVDTLKEQLQKLTQEKNIPLRQAQLGRILIEEKAPQLAINLLKPLTEKAPDYRDAHYLLGAAYFQANQTEAAQKSLQQALKIDPNYEPAKKLLEQISAKFPN